MGLWVRRCRIGLRSGRGAGCGQQGADPGDGSGRLATSLGPLAGSCRRWANRRMQRECCKAARRRRVAASRPGARDGSVWMSVRQLKLQPARVSSSSGQSHPPPLPEAREEPVWLPHATRLSRAGSALAGSSRKSASSRARRTRWCEDNWARWTRRWAFILCQQPFRVIRTFPRRCHTSAQSTPSLSPESPQARPCTNYSASLGARA